MLSGTFFTGENVIMSKYKTVKQQEEKRAKEQASKKKPRQKWTRPKDFQFLPPIKFLPGFRSGKHWKRIIAFTYYLVSPFALFNSVGLFLMVLSFPFVLFSLISIAKTKEKFYMIEFIIALAVFFAGNMLFLNWIQGKIAGLS